MLGFRTSQPSCRPGDEYPHEGLQQSPIPSLRPSIPHRSSFGVLEGTSPRGPHGNELMPPRVKSDYARVTGAGRSDPRRCESCGAIIPSGQSPSFVLKRQPRSLRGVAGVTPVPHDASARVCHPGSGWRRRPLAGIEEGMRLSSAFVLRLWGSGVFQAGLRCSGQGTLLNSGGIGLGCVWVCL